ncbi:CAP domain-containing protein [Xanthomarina sp. F2636L]|uniref:CAP domain-containing protein n=1 Tax=Xanthomarina sp. F2636L TaxID=2996018 RepID=UPI00225E343E|nr:CAP domain-containing protein [Xanthomarina sp. F2636L]MCX7550470.1 CAP domain-containing protein [Xanthomarina sp. F2636L]
MKKPTLLPVMVLFALLSFSCSTDNLDETANNVNSNLVVPETKVIEIEIVELINDYRLSIGLNPLDNMEVIKSQAYSHTDYMIEKDNVSHDNFYQRKTYLVNHVGANKVSENVAYGFTSAESVVNAWLNSPGHKENIEGDFTNFDISAEKNSNGKWYYTNIFVKK